MAFQEPAACGPDSACHLQSAKGHYYSPFLHKGGQGAWNSMYLHCQWEKPVHATATVDEKRAKQMGDNHEVEGHIAGAAMCESR